MNKEEDERRRKEKKNSVRPHDNTVMGQQQTGNGMNSGKRERDSKPMLLRFVDSKGLNFTMAIITVS